MAYFLVYQPQRLT